ncbi:ATP-dependent DNA ligase [Frigoribacterium sp. CFBP 13605]|uniref:DUF7882 family protein n=1 Tax=Frigoribacterium sp. CFBP 13605 TaxID=2774034 RepID=UPI0019082D06|nr:ATP-dependent DNA ligase [Frigoribacterium sp. CFBP 13605]MBD8141130.1 ATP-dependent DNA ligase [Frigoribacterium sp. CFBP 13605]
MGKLAYDRSLTIDFDDRTLAHLQIVIGMKMRRGESFYFSWKDDHQVGDGRTSIWLHPTIPLVYKYYGSRSPAINPAWIHALEVSANTNSGLHIVPEPSVPINKAI